MSIQKEKDNIKRHEIKFVFTSKDENKLLKNNKLKKIFPDRIVESIYFDTSEFKFFHLSEEGVTPRIKIRIRTTQRNGEYRFISPLPQFDLIFLILDHDF